MVNRIRVKLNPEKIKTQVDLENVISYMNNYGKKYDCTPVVVRIQNNQLGAVYSIYSEEKANYFKDHPTSENILNIYNISFYENMRYSIKNLKREKLSTIL